MSNAFFVQSLDTRAPRRRRPLKRPGRHIQADLIGAVEMKGKPFKELTATFDNEEDPPLFDSEDVTFDRTAY